MYYTRNLQSQVHATSSLNEMISDYRYTIGVKMEFTYMRNSRFRDRPPSGEFCFDIQHPMMTCQKTFHHMDEEERRNDDHCDRNE